MHTRRTHDPHMKSPIKNHIRRLRFEAGEITQETLAQRCGATRQTIISLEAGKYTPSLELAFRIARALNTNVESVFEWQDESPPTP
jgi:putative transcriptional regulator